MPGGYKNINGKDGNTFSSNNQPHNRGRKPSIRKQLAEMIEQDGKIILPIKALIKKTKSTITIQLPTQQAICLKLFQIVSRGKPQESLRAIQMIMDQIDGKPRQSLEIQNRELPHVIEHNPAATRMLKEEHKLLSQENKELRAEIEEMKSKVQ